MFVSPSTVLRVALKNRVQLPGEPFRTRPLKPPFPEISWERNRIWIWDASHFTRCKRVAYAIVDVVTRYWIGYLLTTEQTHTQAYGARESRPIQPTQSRFLTQRLVCLWLRYSVSCYAAASVGLRVVGAQPPRVSSRRMATRAR